MSPLSSPSPPNMQMRWKWASSDSSIKLWNGPPRPPRDLGRQKYTAGGNVNWYTHSGEQYGDPLKKTENRATIWLSNPTPGHISREKHGSKGYTHPSITAALFTMAKTWKQPKCPLTDEWIYIQTMDYYSAIKKNEIMPFAATWIDLEIIILSEVSQKEKDKYCDITYVQNLKK